jgi:ribosomal protein L32
MNEIKQKLADLELALNYACYDAALIPKLSKVWDKLELLKAEVNKNCNTLAVSDKVCVKCGKNPPYIQNTVCQECLSKQGY